MLNSPLYVPANFKLLQYCDFSSLLALQMVRMIPCLDFLCSNPHLVIMSFPGIFVQLSFKTENTLLYELLNIYHNNCDSFRDIWSSSVRDLPVGRAYFIFTSIALMLWLIWFSTDICWINVNCVNWSLKESELKWNKWVVTEIINK